MPKVTVYKGRNVVFEHFVKGDEVVIGRSSDVQIPLDHPLVSRRHARIRRQGHSWILEEQGSKNGLFVNGQLVNQKVLKHEDTIEIAQHLLVWHRPESEAESDRAKDAGRPGAGFRLSTTDIEEALTAKKGDSQLVRAHLDGHARTAVVSPEALASLMDQMQKRRSAHLAAVLTNGERKDHTLEKERLAVGWLEGSDLRLPGKRWFGWWGQEGAELRAVPGAGWEIKRLSWWTPVRVGDEALSPGGSRDIKDGDVVDIAGNKLKFHDAVQLPAGPPTKSKGTPIRRG
jgi:hypothetical protein